MRAAVEVPQATDQRPSHVGLSPASRSLHSLQPSTDASGSFTAADRVMASELRDRSEPGDALSMMVSSMVRMVQAGKTSGASASRWSAS
jgi:hypothetical protein